MSVHIKKKLTINHQRERLKKCEKVQKNLHVSMLFITAKKTPLIGKEIVNTNFITLYSFSMKMRFFGYKNNNNNNNYNG